MKHLTFTANSPPILAYLTFTNLIINCIIRQNRSVIEITKFSQIYQNHLTGSQAQNHFKRRVQAGDKDRFYVQFYGSNSLPETHHSFSMQKSYLRGKSHGYFFTIKSAIWCEQHRPLLQQFLLQPRGEDCGFQISISKAVIFFTTRLNPTQNRLPHI